MTAPRGPENRGTGSLRAPAAPLDEFSRTLYDDIRRVAAGQLRREKSARSICVTDLAHDALERALRQDAGRGVTRAELMRRIARLCRQVLVDRARARGRLRRGDGARPERLDVDPTAAEGLGALDLLALDDALARLARLDPRHAEIVELRFFTGASMPEVAEALGLSLSAVEKDWRKARAWLALALEDGESGGGG